MKSFQFTENFQFNRNEFAGSLGDLGTILPLALGMIMINGLNPVGVFFSVGLFYILTGLYFKITVPVQPMKVIGAYSIATAITTSQIQASSLLIAIVLLLLSLSGTITTIGKYIPTVVIRGIQFSTGTLLLIQGFKLITGMSILQQIHNAAEPYLALQSFIYIPVNLLLAAAGLFITFFLLNNKRIPAGIIIVLFGIISGVLLGTHTGSYSFSISFPKLLPEGVPTLPDFSFVLLALVLPQLPMTIGNAVIANADLSIRYFGSTASRMTYPALCISMCVGNIISFLFGGMPLCHGAGGLAAHYRFGARTAGSNLMIGIFFLFLVLIFGKNILHILQLIPLSVLGILLVFAGSELCLTVKDMREKQDLFVIIWMIGITLTVNLAVAAIAGICLYHILKKVHLS